MHAGIVLKLTGIAVFAALTGQASTSWLGGVNDDWFEAGNWNNGVPGTADAYINIGNADTGGVITVSGTASGLTQLSYYSGLTTPFSISGGTLSFDTASTTAIINNGSPLSQTINSAISMIAGNSRNILVGGGLVLNGSISRPGSELGIIGSDTGAGGFFNGSFSVSDLNLSGTDSTHTFSNTTPNSITGQLRLNATGMKTVVNTAENTVFFDGINIQVNADTEITFNHANVLGDSSKLTVGASPASFVMNFNADEDLGYLKIVTTKGGTVLDLGADVESLVFDDSSGQTWGSELVITNFRSGVISFGTDSSGLTVDQLDLITAYDSAGTDVSLQLQIDETGTLVLPEGSVWTGAVNDDWYNVGNWAGSIPGQTTGTVATISSADTGGSIFVDAAATNLSQLLFDAAVQTNFTVSGSTLDFSVDSAAAVIKNESPFLHIINSDISVPNSTTNQRDFICGQGMVFNGDISKPGDIMYFEGDNGGNGIFYNGSLTGESLTLGGYQSMHTFGNTTSNSFSSTLRLGGGIEVIVNTAANTVFFDGPYIQINSGESSMTFNNANVLGDSTRVTVGSVPDSFLMNFNADEDLGGLRIVTDKGGTMINLGSEVASLSFDDSSAEPWNSGLVITNFRPGVISFGTDSGGLSSAQLDLITAYDITGADVSSQLELNTSGVLTGPPPVQGYDAWATTWGDAVLGAATNDYDGDACNNFCEYVFNGNPTNAAVRGEVPQLLADGATLTYVTARRNDDPALTYIVETTAALVSPSWTNTGYIVTGTNVTGGVFDYVTNMIVVEDPQKFVRVKVISE